MSDKSRYTDDGDRTNDPRRGFGDDMGTRVGRPDGASADGTSADGTSADGTSADGTSAAGAQEAPYDASGPARPGQTSTNREAVADGLEGSIEDGEGAEQRRVQRASVEDAGGDRGSDVNPDPVAGDARPTYEL